MFLNLHFVAAGAVNPSAFYLLAQGAVLLAVAEASGGRIERVLGIVTIASATIAVVSVAYIRTLHPGTVIDDPAAMFVTLGILTVLGCELVRWRRLPTDQLDVDRHRTTGSPVTIRTTRNDGSSIPEVGLGILNLPAEAESHSRRRTYSTSEMSGV